MKVADMKGASVISFYKEGAVNMKFQHKMIILSHFHDTFRVYRFYAIDSTQDMHYNAVNFVTLTLLQKFCMQCK